MRITLLVPGTGSFYCGSCLRDHALGKALRGLGHEVEVVPLYLPLYLEDGEDRDEPVQMGGINLYLHQKFPALERVHWASRGLDSPGLLRWASKRGDMTSATEHAEMLLSMLRGEAGRQRRDVERLAAELAQRERPDVFILSNAMLLGIVRTLKERLGVPIVCTLQGEAPYLDALPEDVRKKAWREVAERAAEVDAFTAVSAHYGEVMRPRLGVAAERLHVVHNGIELKGLAEDTGPTGGPPTIGFLARMCPDKGLHTLVDATIELHRSGRFGDLRLEVAGALLGGDRAWLEGLERKLVEAGLEGRFRFRADIGRDEKLALLRSLSVLSVPATYGESFGLYVLEALAAGVPVVEPRHAAFPELLEATGGGVLCEPDDPQSLARELGGLLADPERARALGATGRASVRERFTAEHMARGVAEVCRGVTSE